MIDPKVLSLGVAGGIQGNGIPVTKFTVQYLLPNGCVGSRSLTLPGAGGQNLFDFGMALRALADEMDKVATEAQMVPEVQH